MLSPELLNKVKCHSSDSSGRECQYYKLSDTRGLKVYRKNSNRTAYNPKAVRDEYYYLQNAFHAVGLAPETFGKFDIDNGDDTLYCMVTEHLPLANTWSDDDDIKFRVNLIERFGVDAEDLFYKNMGQKDGRLVPIDFGAFYIENWDKFRELLEINLDN